MVTLVITVMPHDYAAVLLLFEAGEQNAILFNN